MWSEIELVRAENRHELILHGNEISSRINTDGLDKNLFNLTSLNLLRISDTCLSIIPEEISNLINLQSLLLHSNKIETITDKIGVLTKLKTLDLSNNQLKIIPESVCLLHHITSLNISSNQLENFPKLKDINKLTVLDLSNNNLTEFPDICYGELLSLSEINLKSNKITSIPSDINKLFGLKLLDLTSNDIKTIPGELSDCTKLKEFHLKDNPVQDKRLYKLINQCRTKQILDYIRQHCPRKGGQVPTGGNKKSSKKNRNDLKTENDSDLINKLNDCEISSENNGPKIIVSKIGEDTNTPNIKITEDVKKVRPFILACIIRNLKFDEQSFRKFIQMQTKLHETICEKRTVATIATHDFKKVFTENLQFQDLTYTAKPPDQLLISPLGRGGTVCTGTKLFQQLKTEAENFRREKKRNTYSGIHKYLHLLEGRPQFPCLCDCTGNVISFPPITNSENTRISLETKDILVEVTSPVGIEVCRKTLNAILKETALMGISDGDLPQHVTVDRIKVVDLEGNLKNVYPSKVDLNFTSEDGILVVRE